jgi:hypothetical protein
MAVDIFKFWSQVGPNDYQHPADRDVLQRVGSSFDLRCLPGCFRGPLRTAPVVLLYLSPGLNPAFEKDYLKEARSRAGRVLNYRTRSGRVLLPGPAQLFPAWKWWTSRTACFGEWQKVQDKVAILNICAYHSKSFDDKPLLVALPSSRVSLDWAQGVLFPEAIAGKRVVVCLRAASFWGLRTGKRGRQYGESLFCPLVTRSGHMANTAMRNRVISAARRKLELA